MGYQDEILQIRQERAQRDILRPRAHQGAIPGREQERDQAAARVMPRLRGLGREASNWKTNGRVSSAPAATSTRGFRANQSIPQRAPSLLSRHGAAAVQASKAAHALAVQSGLKVDTEDYFKFCSDALEMHGKDINGMRFDPSEKVPHANEVCR